MYKNQEILVYNHFYIGLPKIIIDASKYDVLLSNVSREKISDSMKLKRYELLVPIRKY